MSSTFLRRMSLRRQFSRHMSARPACQSRPGLRPAKAFGAPVWLPALLFACALGGCSSSWKPAPPAPAAIGGASVASIRPAAEVEFDGLETQRPPRRRPEPAEPDDPSEPFSPNYGAPRQGDDGAPHQPDDSAPRQAATALEAPLEPAGNS
jgi:hypothetical protein